jgi:3D (Asp-Asp-Asp) domain-containing protein
VDEAGAAVVDRGATVDAAGHSRLPCPILALVLTWLLLAVAPQQFEARRLRVLVTAYCLHGTTATGTSVHRGTVAVDPNLIPLGSLLLIPGYGYGRAEDTGAAVHGYHVDEWRPSCGDAFRATRHETITVWR